MEFKDKNILLVGLAKTGVSAIKKLVNLGAKVTVNDIKKFWEALLSYKLISETNTKLMLTPQARDEEDIYGYGVWIANKENGDYLKIYMGISQYGIDLFVPDDALELAKGLLESDVIDMPEEIDIEGNIIAEEKYQVKRKSIVWIILTYLFLPIVLAIIIGIIFNR